MGFPKKKNPCLLAGDIKCYKAFERDFKDGLLKEVEKEIPEFSLHQLRSQNRIKKEDQQANRQRYCRSVTVILSQPCLSHGH